MATKHPGSESNRYSALRNAHSAPLFACCLGAVVAAAASLDDQAGKAPKGSIELTSGMTVKVNPPPKHDKFFLLTGCVHAGQISE